MSNDNTTTIPTAGATGHIRDGRTMAGVLERGLGRRDFLKAAMATSTLGVGATITGCSGDHAEAAPSGTGGAASAQGFAGPPYNQASVTSPAIITSSRLPTRSSGVTCLPFMTIRCFA